MPALILVLIILSLSLLINRIATIALVLTGLSRASASFQARSAFTGVGFTTNEAEKIVNHPVRRRIIMWLMLIGNVGIITTIASLLLTVLNDPQPRGLMIRFGLLTAGLVVLWVLINSRWIDRYLSRLIRWAFQRWSNLDVRDYNSLLHLSGAYRVTELEVNPESWLANQRLADLRLRQEGIVVLGIQRNQGRFIGAPKGKTQIRPYDTLILYGRVEGLAELDERYADAAGERAHHKAIADHERLLEEERQQDKDE